jgi:hypothetical protein
LLSSGEQVAVFVVERQQPLFSCRVRLDRSVHENVADGKSAFGEVARYQQAAVAVERLASGAHKADARAYCRCG